jgi:hypothetical protein
MIRSFVILLINFISLINLFPVEIKLPDGSIYTGVLVDGLFEGNGKQHWLNGSFYEGEFKKGYYNGFGKLHTIEFTYEGFFSDGLMNGEGILRFTTGDTIYGIFKNGYVYGMGRIEYQNGDVYEGHIVNNIRNGAGNYIRNNGDIYIGNFERDMFNGWGTYYELNGNYYIGEFFDNQYHGNGKYVSKESIFRDVIYEGIFVNGNLPEKYITQKKILDKTKNIFIFVMIIFNIILLFHLIKRCQSEVSTDCKPTNSRIKNPISPKCQFNQNN